jgi:hypothetical protein
MKTFLKVIAWTGLGLFTIGVAISFYVWMALINYNPGPNPTFGPEGWWLIIVPVDILGLLLMYIGGLIARPRYLWPASISVGLLHIVVSVPPEWSFLIRSIHESREGLVFGLLSFFVLPGLAAILLGMLLLIIEKLLKKRNQKEV